MTNTNPYISFFVSFSTRIWYDEYFGRYSGTAYRDEIRGKLPTPERESEELSAIMNYTWTRDYHTYNIAIGYDTLVISSWLTVPMEPQNPIGSLIEETDKILEDLEKIFKYTTEEILTATKTHLLPGTLFLGWERMSRYIQNTGDITQLTKDIGDRLLSKSPDKMWVYSRGTIREEVTEGSSNYHQVIASEAVKAGPEGIPLPMMARDWVLLNLGLQDSYFAEIELGREFIAIRQNLSKNVNRFIRKGPSGDMNRDRLVLENNIEILTERTRRMEKRYKYAEVFDPCDWSSIPKKEINHPTLITALSDIRPSYLSWDTLDSIRKGSFCDFPMQKLARDFEIQRRAESSRIRTFEVIISVLAPIALFGVLYLAGVSTDDLLSFIANILQVATFIVVILILLIIASSD